jgi:hypothetical protein
LAHTSQGADKSLRALSLTWFAKSRQCRTQSFSRLRASIRHLKNNLEDNEA